MAAIQSHPLCGWWFTPFLVSTCPVWGQAAMTTDKTAGQRLVALFWLGAALFNYPIVSLFNRNFLLAGVPVFFLALFVIWLVLILLIGLATRRRPLSDSPGPPGD
jgi:hypothetical protein